MLSRLTTKSEPSGVAVREKHASKVPASLLKVGLISTDTAGNIASYRCRNALMTKNEGSRKTIETEHNAVHPLVGGSLL